MREIVIHSVVCFHVQVLEAGGVSLSVRESTMGRVLVIDDDPVVRELMESFLVRAGYAVTLAESGPSGLQRAHEIKPDVITLDIAMPGMDGWSVLSSLKKRS